uniref:Uncharacterized protein n=1 Tax=Glossina pallidipes TaxID=7398 RepID=A0A1A9Z1D9_GLOPL
DVEFSDDDDLIDPEPSGSNKKTFVSTLFSIPNHIYVIKELKFQNKLTSSASSSKHTDNPSVLSLLLAKNMRMFTLSRWASSNSYGLSNGSTSVPILHYLYWTTSASLGYHILNNKPYSFLAAKPSSLKLILHFQPTIN